MKIYNALSIALAFASAQPVQAQDNQSATPTTVTSNGKPDQSLDFRKAVDNFSSSMDAYFDDKSDGKCRNKSAENIIAAKAAADQAREIELRAMTPHEKEIALNISKNGVQDTITKYGEQALTDIKLSVISFGIADRSYETIKPSYGQILGLNMLQCDSVGKMGAYGKPNAPAATP